MGWAWFGRVGGIGVAAAALAGPSIARADDLDRATCIQVYVAAQSDRKAGSLLRARQRLELCANTACPGMVQRDCSQWLDEVSRALPTIVLAARDDAGGDLRGATATVDGTPVALDGHPIPLDPGQHLVRVSTALAGTKEQSFVLAEGEHDRAVVVAFTTAKPAPLVAEGPPPVRPTRSSSSVPLASWVLGGVGVVALGAFTYFAVRGATDRSGLGCDRGC